MNVGDTVYLAYPYEHSPERCKLIHGVYRGEYVHRGETYAKVLLPGGSYIPRYFHAWRIRATREEAVLDQALVVLAGKAPRNHGVPSP